MKDNYLKQTLLTIVKIYIISISIFFAFRLVLFISDLDRLDLITEKRPYIIINGDNKAAALDTNFLFVLKNNEKMLYQYKNHDRTNYINDYPDKAKEMEIYLKSNLQVYQYMLNNEKTLYSTTPK